MEGMQEEDEVVYLLDYSLHRQMSLTDALVEVGLKKIVYEFVSDEAKIPPFGILSLPARSYLALLCARCFIACSDELHCLDGEATYNDRQAVFIKEVARVYSEASTSLSAWRCRAALSPGGFTFGTFTMPANPPPPFPSLEGFIF